MKLFIFSAIAFVSFVTACGSRPADTTPNNVAQQAGEQAAASPAMTPTTPTNPVGTDAKPVQEDEKAGDTADFAGTAGVTEKKNPNIKAVAVMSEVRTARHGNYDRIVFEFLGPDLPTYHVEYIDKPVRSCGSGDTVPLAGDGWLEVRFTDAQAHTPEGQPTIKDRLRSPNLPVIKDLKLTCDFEAEVTWVAGVKSPNRYRVIELNNPTRLAVDIKN